jgi:ribosomal protein L20
MQHAAVLGGDAPCQGKTWSINGAHKKVLKQAKGFRGRRKNVFHRQTGGDEGWAIRLPRSPAKAFRALWITRINAAVREPECPTAPFRPA